jgi:hypothetical protein
MKKGMEVWRKGGKQKICGLGHVLLGNFLEGGQVSECQLGKLGTRKAGDRFAWRGAKPNK